MTKSFTALCILELRDEASCSSKIRRNATCLNYRLEVSGTDSPKPTIRHLLTHSTGFPDKPMGDQQLQRPTRILRDDEGGIPFSNPPDARDRTRAAIQNVSQPRVRHALCQLCAGEHPETPIECNDLERSPSPPAGWHMDTAGRTTSGRKSRRCRTARSDRWAEWSRRHATSRDTSDFS